MRRCAGVPSRDANATWERRDKASNPASPPVTLVTMSPHHLGRSTTLPFPPSPSPARRASRLGSASAPWLWITAPNRLRIRPPLPGHEEPGSKDPGFSYVCLRQSRVECDLLAERTARHVGISLLLPGDRGFPRAPPHTPSPTSPDQHNPACLACPAAAQPTEVDAARRR